MFSLACAAIASTLHTARPTGTGRWYRGWLRPEWIVTAFGVCLLIWQWSAARPLWLDEQMIALNLRDRTFWDLSHPLSFDQSAPFGWLLLERIALLGLGANELALRLAPALFGIATLLCALMIGQRWMSPVGATAFALLCSFGQWLSFYAVELKHYSADAFGGLLLPALTVWVAEADADNIRTRLAVWGAVVAVAHWFSIGALLVTPVCAALLTVVLMRSRPRPSVLYLCGIAGMCALSFGVHYAVALRYARESEYLRNFWQFAFPPASAGVVATLEWLRDQLDDFALKPGGTELAVLFWASAAAGFVLTRRRLLGSIAAAVVFSGFLFAVLRLVPLYERVSLWFVPALYLGVALFADSAASFVRQSRGRWGWVSAGIAAVAAIVTFQVCSDVFRHGADDVRNFRPAGSNRGNRRSHGHFVADESAAARRCGGDDTIGPACGLVVRRPDEDEDRGRVSRRRANSYRRTFVGGIRVRHDAAARSTQREAAGARVSGFSGFSGVVRRSAASDTDRRRIGSGDATFRISQSRGRRGARCACRIDERTSSME